MVDALDRDAIAPLRDFRARIAATSFRPEQRTLGELLATAVDKKLAMCTGLRDLPASLDAGSRDAMRARLTADIAASKAAGLDVARELERLHGK